jgi:membrane fusion protein (multidrug efflux system)
MNCIHDALPASYPINKFKQYIMKTIYLAVVSVLLTACGSAPQNAAAPGPVSVPVKTLEAENSTTYQDYPASVQGIQNVEIRPQVSGTLENVFVDEGAFVRAGQLIFKINEQPFIAALNSAMASQQAAQSALTNAHLEVDKITPLVAGNVVSVYQLKTANAALDIAKANLSQASAMVKSARINLGYTLIKSPVNGYISKIPKKRGSLVSPVDIEPLTHLSDIHQVRVYFSLSERDYVIFKSQYPGETIETKIKNLPEVSLLLSDDVVFGHTGKIDMVDGQFDNSTGAITLRASFPNPDGLLRSGNSGKIRLSLKHHGVIAVPQESTVELQDKVMVYALGADNKVQMKAIKIEARSGTDYLVSEGIDSGERIILSGFGTLQEGTAVRPEPVNQKK